jgi:ABC-type antimicrobial peptide transport system permease subunit
MLVRESLQVTAIGVALGLLIALVSAGMMQSLLFGLQPRDPLTFIAAFAMVVLDALAASFLPARQAACVAPMQALRME